MSDDAFDFGAALAARKAEERVQSEQAQRRVGWQRESGANDYIAVRRVSPEVERTIQDFLDVGGRIRSDRTVWIPSDHPYEIDIVIDQGCIASPPLPKFRSADTYSAARAEWEAERDRIRAEVTAVWDKKYPRAAAMDFGYREQEGPHETIWILVDKEGAAWTFGSCGPSLDRVRKDLVEVLFRESQG